jgi:hydrogenase nickel incorporation protein HypB
MQLIGDKEIKYFHHTKPHKPNHKHGPGDAGVETRVSGTREIKVVRRVLDINDAMAAQNRQRFAEQGTFVLNIMSSPGSGKTTLLEKTLGAISAEMKTAIIVGDICTTNDADRLATSGVPVVQVNTNEFGGDCHLTAQVIEKAYDSLGVEALDFLVVENVGNLVCPAEFDIGEDARAVLLSVTEGEDKPLKYPLMFRESHVALLSKIDLLPYLDFDRQAALDSIHNINPDMPVL